VLRRLCEGMISWLAILVSTHRSLDNHALRLSAELSVTWLCPIVSSSFDSLQTLGKQEVKQHGEQVLRGEETMQKRRGSTSDWAVLVMLLCLFAMAFISTPFDVLRPRTCSIS
jgi:hypothetical protein